LRSTSNGNLYWYCVQYLILVDVVEIREDGVRLADASVKAAWPARGLLRLSVTHLAASQRQRNA